MKSRRFSIAPAALFAALLFCGGCSTFRALFDEDPAVTQQKREKAKKQREEKLRSGEESGVFPTLLSGKKKEKDDLYVSSSLTPEERAILEQTEAASKRRSDADEVEQIRRENRERSKKASDSVFGGGVKDWF